ncbi:hypothetical protein HJ590_02515 [Naumannella sp. ID2617S]|uniref:Uncharacterized protein n=1 Tax=Enemella dayhoffiae TaxID=2016507 RepID=A0A255H2R8_9ACTN|nr:hypothetical protein [Enemella dayhoffiae]NNG18460.1 hypothetical protein [Naumannella sp. ID2617S]OYO21626.1 hypothetical protein CGZ93_10005 [Enemella dayhoffiae]
MAGGASRRRRTVDRFHGRILGAGSSSGVRLVVGDWLRSPLGTFTDVMVADAAGHRVLLAPTEEVAAYVAQTYRFDEVVTCRVELGADWTVDAGPLRARFEVGGRTPVGRLLHALPAPLAGSRAVAVLADPIARRVFPGVRTVGTAGNGRREYYGALDQHAVTDLGGSWQGAPLGTLTPVTPAPGFGFSSTPELPSLTRVVTTVVRDG